MPTLNWIGKDAVVKHHQDVPYRLLEPVPALSCGTASSGNLIVQGDNLHALKSLLPRGDEKDGQYKFEDEKGIFRSSDYTCSKSAEERPNLYYPVTNPNTGDEVWPKRTRVWAYSQGEHARNVEENLIYWGKDGKGKVPAYKRYRHELRNADGVVPQSMWAHDFAGHTDTARIDLREVLFGFAGSGTTGHAVLKQNAADGGTRRFILVEMDENIAANVTAERVKRVSQGYTNAKGETVAGLSPLGSGFQFCTLSAEPLFTPQGEIREDVRYAQLAEFVWFAETGGSYTPNVLTGRCSMCCRRLMAPKPSFLPPAAWAPRVCSANRLHSNRRLTRCRCKLHDVADQPRDAQ